MEGVVEEEEEEEVEGVVAVAVDENAAAAADAIVTTFVLLDATAAGLALAAVATRDDTGRADATTGLAAVVLKWNSCFEIERKRISGEVARGERKKKIDGGGRCRKAKKECTVVSCFISL